MSATRLARRLRAGLMPAPLLALLCGFLVIPLLFVLWGSVEGARLDFGHYERVLATPANRGVLLHTIAVGLMVTGTALVVGYPVAFFMTRLRPRAFSIVTVLVLIPLFTAFLIRTYAWMVILGRQGIVNNALQWLGLVSEPLTLLGTTFAVVLGMSHVFVPIAVFTMYSAMARIDRDYASAAQILGATPVQAFLRVYLPMSLPGVMSAGVLIFVISIGFYITPALLGGPGDTMISQLIVVQMTTLLNFELGFASSIVLLVLTVAILFVASLFIPLEMIWSSLAAAEPRDDGRRGRAGGRLGRLLGPLAVAVEGALHAVTAPLLTRRSVWLWAWTVAVLVFLTAPLAVIVILSFSASPFVIFPPPGFSLQWWEKLAAAHDWHAAFLFSVLLGVVSAIVATVVGTMGAFWLVRTRLRIKRGLFLFSLSPLMVPVVIIATSLYVFEARIGILGTFAGLVVGHALLATPYAVVVMSSALRGFDRTLEHAAAVHGARPLQGLRRVTLPILRPALLTAGLLAFLTSFDELLVSIFLIGRQTPTLPIKFWGDIKYQIDPLLSAASTLIVGLVTLVVLSVQGARARRSGTVPAEIPE